MPLLTEDELSADLVDVPRPTVKAREALARKMAQQTRSIQHFSGDRGRDGSTPTVSIGAPRVIKPTISWKEARSESSRKYGKQADPGPAEPAPVSGVRATTSGSARTPSSHSPTK
jgi:hypothetical protein